MKITNSIFLIFALSCAVPALASTEGAPDVRMSEPSIIGVSITPQFDPCTKLALGTISLSPIVAAVFCWPETLIGGGTHTDGGLR